MFVDLTPEQHALRHKVRDYFQALMTPAMRDELRGKEGGELFRQTIRQMGRDGWLAVGWPKAHGGKGSRGGEARRRTRTPARPECGIGAFDPLLQVGQQCL